MISEIWLSGSPQHPQNAPLSDANYRQLFANLAFHELMHNKLDASTISPVLSDIHYQGGGGLASVAVNAGTPLTEKNKELMAANLARPIPQNTAGAAVNIEVIGDDLTRINGKPAPRPD